MKRLGNANINQTTDESDLLCINTGGRTLKLFSLVCTVDVKYECAFYISKVKLPFSFFFERENVAEEK